MVMLSLALNQLSNILPPIRYELETTQALTLESLVLNLACHLYYNLVYAHDPTHDFY